MDAATKRTVSKIILVTASIWLLLWLTAYEPKTSNDAESVTNIDTAIVHYKMQPKMITIYGKISPKDPYHIDALVAEKLIDLPVNNGTQVQKGDLIAQFDTTKLNIQRITIEKTIEKTNSKITALTQEEQSLDTLIEHDQQLLSNAKDLLSRYDSLSEKYKSQQGINQRQDTVAQRSKALQQNQTNQVTIQHRIEQLRTDLVTHQFALLDKQLDIDKSKVIAPNHGMVTDLKPQVGDYLKQGEPICVVIQPKNTYVHAYIPTTYFNLIEVGQVARIKNIDNTPLILSTFDQQVDPQSAHLDGLFDFQSSRPQYPIGQIISLAIEIPVHQESFTAPESAIYHETFVYTINNDSLQEAKVTVLGTFYKDNKTLYLLSSPDVSEGSQLLVSRLPRPRTGMSVRYE